MWINIDEEHIKTLDAAALTAHLQELIEQDTHSEVEQKYLDAAREHASDGDLEIDDSAVVSVSDDGGAYVMAWKWIDAEEVPL